MGPGQERHLTHELTHVAQQKQGIVRPTTYINGLPVNDSPALERSASAPLQLTRHMTGYRPFHDTRGIIQMLAYNSHLSRDSKNERRYRISNITLDPQRHGWWLVTCTPLQPGDVNITYSENMRSLSSTITYLRFQQEWISHYSRMAMHARSLDVKLSVLRDALASATNTGEDAYFLLKLNLDDRGNAIDTSFIPEGVKGNIKRILDETRQITGEIQWKVFSSLQGYTFPQTHYNAVDRIKHTGMISLAGVNTRGKDDGSMHPRQLPTCVAYVQLPAAGEMQFVCLNSKTAQHRGLLPKYIHPALAESIRSLSKEQIMKYRTTAGVGTHAEVYTVNKLLKACHDASRIPRGSRLHIISPEGRERYTYFGRCAHCHDIIESLHLSDSLSLAFEETETSREVSQSEDRRTPPSDSRGGSTRGRGGIARGRGGSSRGRGGIARGRGAPQKGRSTP